MPSYIYGCSTCNTVFTQVRAVEEREQPATCRKCGTSSTKRLFKEPIKIQVRESFRASPTQAKQESITEVMWDSIEDRYDSVIDGFTVTGMATGIIAGGNGRTLARNVRATYNGVAIDVGDDAVWQDYNTIIE
jgi:putative FmdB family regulatory protein